MTGRLRLSYLTGSGARTFPVLFLAVVYTSVLVDSQASPRSSPTANGCCAATHVRTSRNKGLSNVLLSVCFLLFGFLAVLQAKESVMGLANQSDR
ncbi:MAG: hypothetical protein L0H42_12435 [Yaniella sp.]|uniref:hypothetical protein n=1 Tax=Yaniella sp. TaxID=2773929 RepID=UPI0026483F12|nr:hypothetical protein [Yaniella sp.]MDN5819106.1 hypothetical protein [Yaniella sp.]